MKPMKMYRIICTVTGKALVSGSNMPNSRPAYAYGAGEPIWFERGYWSESGGAFWKTEQTVKRHLQYLCHDWMTKSAPMRYPRYEGQMDHWQEVIRGSRDWSRLEHLKVETLLITNYSTIQVSASDFMGIPVGQPAARVDA
jgi:hypothetical protein